MLRLHALSCLSLLLVASASAVGAGGDQCNGFGSWDEGKGLCVCDAAHAGDACEYDVVSRRKVGVSRRLTCKNGVVGCPGNAELCDAAVCNCHEGWTGPSCDVKAEPKTVPVPVAIVSPEKPRDPDAQQARFVSKRSNEQLQAQAEAEETFGGSSAAADDRTFTCPAKGAPNPCAHGGSLVRQGGGSNKCSCSCKGDWSGSRCSECPAQDCAHGGRWNPAKCACDCPKPWRSADHCASCETRACSNGGSFNPSTCSCSCSGLWKGPECNKCSVEEGDVERIDRLCGKKGFNVASCSCNAECPNVRCMNGGILDPHSCTCMCNAGTSPDLYFTANEANEEAEGEGSSSGGAEGDAPVVVVGAGAGASKKAAGSAADSFRFARARRRRHHSSKQQQRHRHGQQQQQLLEVGEEASSLVAGAESGAEAEAEALAMTLLEVDAEAEAEAERSSAEVESFAAAELSSTSAASSTTEASLSLSSSLSSSLSLPGSEQPIDGESLHPFENVVVLTGLEGGRGGEGARFAEADGEGEESGSRPNKGVGNKGSSGSKSLRSYWAGERCQVCLPPPSNPCRAGFVFSLGSCKCEAICDLSLCHNRGSVVLLRPSKSAKDASSKESTSILLEVEEELEHELELSGEEEFRSSSGARARARTPPGSKPAASSNTNTGTDTDRLIATLVANGNKDAVAAADAAKSNVVTAAIRPQKGKGKKDSASSSSSSFVVSAEEFERMRNGLRCGCRCKNGWGGNHCDVRASGATAASAARSCLSILAVRPKAGSGRYWLNPSGVAPLFNAFQAHCDMGGAGAGAEGSSVGGWMTVAKVGSKLASSFIDHATFVNGVSANKGSEYVLPCNRFNGLDGRYPPPLQKLSLDDIKMRVDEAQQLTMTPPAGSEAGGAANTASSSEAALVSPSSSSSSASSSSAAAGGGGASLRHFVLRLQMGAVTDYFAPASISSSNTLYTLCDVLGSSQHHLWSPGFSEHMLDGTAKRVEGGMKAVLEGPPPAPAPAPKPPKKTKANVVVVGAKSPAAKVVVGNKKQQQSPGAGMPAAPPAGVYVAADTSSASSSTDETQATTQVQQPLMPVVTVPDANPGPGGGDNNQLLGASNLLRFAGAGSNNNDQGQAAAQAFDEQGQGQGQGPISGGDFFGSLPPPTQPLLLTPPGGPIASGYGAGNGPIPFAAGANPAAGGSPSYGGFVAGPDVAFAAQQQQQLWNMQRQAQAQEQQQQQQREHRNYQYLRGSTPGTAVAAGPFYYQPAQQQQQQQMPPQQQYYQPAQQQYYSPQQQQQEPRAGTVPAPMPYPVPSGPVVVVSQPQPLPPLVPSVPFYGGGGGGGGGVGAGGGSGGGYAVMLETERRVGGGTSSNSKRFKAKAKAKARRSRRRLETEAEAEAEADMDAEEGEQEDQHEDAEPAEKKQRAAIVAAPAAAVASKPSSSSPSSLVTFSSAAGFSSLRDPAAVWVQPSYVDLTANPQLEGVLGGSDRDWPLAWDGRRYLSIWGGNRGGCCHAKHRSRDGSGSGNEHKAESSKGGKKKEGQKDGTAVATAPTSETEIGSGTWGQDFTLSVIEVDPKLFQLVKKRAAEAKLLSAGSAPPAPAPAPAKETAEGEEDEEEDESRRSKANGHSFAEQGVDQEAEAEAEEQDMEADYAEAEQEEEEGEGVDRDQDQDEDARHIHRFATARGRRARSHHHRRHHHARRSSSFSSASSAAARAVSSSSAAAGEKDETDPLESV